MPERSFVYDLAIIGAGPGGYVAAIKAAQSGIKTALIEKGMVGGVCLHWGCIPTKTLLYSAGIYDKLKKARDYGIVIDTLNVDYSQFHRRKESVVSRLYQGVQFLLKKNGVEVIEGEGQLISPNEILIKKKRNRHWQYTCKKCYPCNGFFSLCSQRDSTQPEKCIHQ